MLTADAGHQWDPDLVSLLIGVLDAAPTSQPVSVPALARVAARI